MINVTQITQYKHYYDKSLNNLMWLKSSLYTAARSKTISN